MKKLLSIFLSFHMYVNAQILVIELDEKNNVKPLSAEFFENDKTYKSIMNLLLKYTWPSCIATDLTTEEKQILLSNEPGAELKFVRKKLQEIDKRLNAIFIPTTLYEIFILSMDDPKKDKKADESKYYSFVTKVDESKYYSFFTKVTVDMDESFLKQIKAEDGDSIKAKELKMSLPMYIKNKIYEEYMKKNESVFSKINILYGHKCFIEEIKNIIGFEDKPLQELEKSILENRYQINQKLYIKNKVFNSKEFMIKMLEKIIDLEYQAFNKNKALLFRGSLPFDIENILDKGTTSTKIIASTILYMYSSNFSSYSISFGNSLFAGFLRDEGACSYIYFQDNKGGYVLFIDKFQYIDNNCANLFFISPLATEAAIFGEGEFFHSHSKPVKKYEEKVESQVKNNRNLIVGLYAELEDDFGIVLITRNPYRHEYLFSKYFLENAVIIGSFAEGNLDSAEQIAVDIMKNQKKINAEYTLRDWFPRWKKMYVELKNKKKKMLQKSEDKSAIYKEFDGKKDPKGVSKDFMDEISSKTITEIKNLLQANDLTDEKAAYVNGYLQAMKLSN